MNKVTKMMVLLMSLALSACATNNQGNHPNTNPDINQPGGDSNPDNGGNTNPDEGGDQPGGNTDPDQGGGNEDGDQPGGNTDPDQGGGNEGGDQPGGNTDPDQGGGNEGGQTEDVPPQNPNRPGLPCGQRPIDRPENAANPIQLSPTRPADEFKLPKPKYYQYIYGNNPNTSKNPFVDELNQGGGYMIKYKSGSPIHGVQTPIWEAWHEEWLKVEVRFTINYWQGNSKKETPTKDPYLFYCFDIQGNLIKEISKPVPTKILDESKYENNERDPYIEIDLENNEENRKIRYVEMRVVDYVNNQAGKSVSTCFSNCRIREYHRTSN